MPSERKPDLVQSLMRGLEVIKVFGGSGPAALTLSEVAETTGLTRATSRRILLTLAEMGYIHQEGRQFSLTPRILELGYSYISSLELWELCQPHMRELVQELRESCSMAVLDLPEIVYVARVPMKRVMTVTLAVGSRLPAHATSMGHVLLAHLPPDKLDGFLATAELEPLTPRTITDPVKLKTHLGQVREQGWALIDQHLETGVRSIAAPIRRPDGSVPAALNVSAHSQRTNLDELRRRFLPRLLDTAAEISADLSRNVGISQDLA